MEKKDKKENTFPRAEEPDASVCQYCGSKDFVKRGFRKKKHEQVQLYLCRVCGKTFTVQLVKGKRYPLHIVLECVSYYNLGFSFEETSRIVEKKFGFSIQAPTISEWVSEFSDVCRYGRMRPYALRKYAPRDMVEVVRMAHRQTYKFCYHRAKTDLLMQEYRQYRLGAIREYLNAVSTETPHQYFQKSVRASEVREKFNVSDVYVRVKKNYATRLAGLALQAVRENKKRHEALQRFMLANDSVTVAVEVPVYITGEDIEHMRTQLGFEIPTNPTGKRKEEEKQTRALITGHIDILQIRNGKLHILDYKPHAEKERPIEQLTWYACALSRLTGLRMYEFMCAWFDENAYYEFFPLHVVYKRKGHTKKRTPPVLKVGSATTLRDLRGTRVAEKRKM